MAPPSPIPQSEEARHEDEMQYGHVGKSKEEIAREFPNRPKNHSKTLAFADLFQELFNPLNENKKQPSGPPARKRGPNGPGSKLSPQEQRRHIITRFIARWRKEVGPDFYPALRLILPDKDRDRGVYGLKESAIGKILVKVIKIDKNSEDGFGLLHWKLPGGGRPGSGAAGDFARRCFEVIEKRPMRMEPGTMSVAEVNEQLDQLAMATSEAENIKVFEVFYTRMNAEEMMWLIRIVLKQMKVGATERTLLDLWHPDGEALFNVSSSLMKVCWELWDPEIRLESEGSGIKLMEVFQPQLAQFQMPASFQKMVDLLRPTEEDDEYWIEEKLDGERMQMHMVQDPNVAGGVKFGWWSRKAKDYTYLYGEGLEQSDSALTRHLKKAFAFEDGVKNMILDGEMITWDMAVDKIVPFGTLKTAALAEKENRNTSDAAAGHRPLFRVFDILLLNDKQLTQYTLRDRHNALERAVKPVHRRLEIHQPTKATSADAIEPLLREVVANASEGLVLKNPRSSYRLNSRNDDWLKVKPEYMSEFGESLDCVVIGAYYGSGRRGGSLSSFLCGLRASPNHIQAGANPEKCFSFFKVGGGFRAEDYAEIRHRTEGKWIDWDRNKPPTEYIELGGGEARQYERPDVWIRPKDSIVISAKAASVGPSDQFAKGFTLRFPRFRRLRLDRSWDSALSLEEFTELKKRVEEEAKDKKMTVESKRKRATKRVKRELVIAGEGTSTAAAEANTKPRFKAEANKIFDGFEFCVLSDSLKPYKKTKAELEALIKEHGGAVSQRAAPDTNMILVADKKVVKVASLIKGGNANVVRPRWIRDCILQEEAQHEGEVLPFEELHLFHGSEAMVTSARQNTDGYGDPFARDVEVEELREILAGMPKIETGFDKDEFLEELEARGRGLTESRSRMFGRCIVHLKVVGPAGRTMAPRLRRYIEYCGGKCVDENSQQDLTHVVVVGDDAMEMGEAADALRRELSSRRTQPRIVSGAWIQDCWKESTVLDEEQFLVN